MKIKKLFEEKEKMMVERAKIRDLMHKKKEQMKLEFEQMRKHKTRSVSQDSHNLSVQSSSRHRKLQSLTHREKQSNTSSSLPKSRKIPRSVGAAPLDRLKRTQQNQLQKLIQNEQLKEKERGELLDSIQDVKEKKRLEKIFGIEREKASKQVLDMIKNFEADIQKTKQEVL